MPPINATYYIKTSGSECFLLPVTSQQEQSRYAWFDSASISYHIKVLTVIVLSIISNENSFASCLLHMSGLLNKGTASGARVKTDKDMGESILIEISQPS